MWMGAPILAAITIFSGAARAEGTAQTDPNLPPLPPSTASAPTPSAAPPAPATSESPRVVVVQTANGPKTYQLAQPKKYKRVWYGWQTLTLDGVAIASGAILAKGDFDGAGWVWIGTYALAPPVVHALHGRFGMAFADLGVRVGAPVVLGSLGLLAGCAAGSGGDDVLDACVVGGVVGFFLGYGAAIAIDAALFAREKVEVEPGEDSDEARELEREKRKRASTFTVMPNVGFGQNRASFGLQGQF
jgi:hypothetical protein